MACCWEVAQGTSEWLLWLTLHNNDIVSLSYTAYTEVPRAHWNIQLNALFDVVCHMHLQCGSWRPSHKQCLAYKTVPAVLS